MRRKRLSVGQRILYTNILMLALIFIAVAVISVLIIRGYAGVMEDTVRTELSNIQNTDQLEHFAKEWTVRRGGFYVAAVLDVGLCAAAFVIISGFFTNRLTRRIVYPLDLLKEGSERVRGRNLKEDIEYSGETEFMEVCETFNDMQHAILEEQEQVARYEKARTDMISGISHDLRTPLAAIQGIVKGLIDGVASTPDMQRKFLDRAYARSREMEKLLEQLLLLSRMETGHIPLHSKKLDLVRVVNDFSSRVPEKSGGRADVRAELPDQAQFVLADPDQVERILNNLLENSMKYSDKPKCEIRIRVRRENDKVILRFSDNGPGVPEEKLPHLFEEFYRADASRNVVKGSGLGLYIVKSLTEAMGGSVSVENDGGLAVTLVLPAQEILPAIQKR